MYRIHSNKHPGGLDKIILNGRLIVSLFIAKIVPKMDDFGQF